MSTSVHALPERMTQNLDGSLGPLTEASTKQVALIVHHTGLARVRCFELRLP